MPAHRADSTRRLPARVRKPVRPAPIGPELVVGLVGAAGTDMDRVSTSLESLLNEVAYKTKVVRPIECLHDLRPWKGMEERPVDVRYQTHMDAGNEFRERIQRGDALAVLALAYVREHRRAMARGKRDPDFPVARQAYLLRGLKRPDEVDTMRRVYGRGFILVAAYSPRESRLERLVSKIAESHHAAESHGFRSAAESVIERDEAEVGRKFSQNVRGTFPLADVFIDASDPEGLENSLRRFVQLLFGHPFHTPTRDEYGMFLAQAAGLRSAALSRQVGASIAAPDGEIVAVGVNEVPRAGGGLYWPGDENDGRDFRLGEDPVEKMRRMIVGEILDRFLAAGWFSDGVSADDRSSLVDKALGVLRNTRAPNLIEFGRIVHAEMAAIADAARRGVALKGATLYTTTFPCHDCARHIVAAGIRRVVYIEPYPKSLARDLYPDSIAVDRPSGQNHHVAFRPFVGVAPREYLDLFEMVCRKVAGHPAAWDPTVARPRLEGSPPTYLLNEKTEIAALTDVLDRIGLGA